VTVLDLRGCWAIAVQWNRKSETRNDDNKDYALMMQGYGRDFIERFRVISEGPYRLPCSLPS
jgi:hypothetical protein